MVYKFFNKKSKGSGAKHVNTKLPPQNQQLVEELHKSIIKKFEKRKVYAAFKGNIWGADLADIQLKDKKGISIATAFQSILKQSNRKPNKIWVDKGSEFYNASFKKWL